MAPAVKKRKLEHSDPKSRDLETNNEPPDHKGSVEDTTKPENIEKDIERKTIRHARPTRPHGAHSSAYATGTFSSSMFKLQAHELLDEMRSKHGKKEREADIALHKIKQTIERIPEMQPLSVEEAERALLISSKVAVPFPNPRPPKDAKYKFAYSKPTSINVIGSHALKTASRTKKGLEVDLVVAMPSSLFQDKDYLNHRYFYKRAYYLACLAAALMSAHHNDFSLRYENFRNDALKPVVVITPRIAPREGVASSKPRWRINLIPCIDEDTFDFSKLLPNKSCVRDQTASAEVDASTPFYNSSLRSDMLMTQHLKLLHSASKSSDAFQDVCLLGPVWLQQRGLGTSIHAGGFGAFEWSALVALLLQSGGPNGRPILSDRYTSYQILKATLQVLAARDLSKQPLTVGSDHAAPAAPGSDLPMVWDAVRSHNLLYKMTPWSYKKLREEARTSLKMLNDSTFDSFDAAFILRVDIPLYRYDHVIELPEVGTMHDYLALDTHKSLYHVLQRGMGDRIQHIDIIPQWTESWEVGAASHGSNTARKLKICLIANPSAVNRSADHGPSAEQKEQSASFRKFWGDKAELRRFKDGSILETVVWSTSDGRSIIEQILQYLLQRHFGIQSDVDITFAGDNVGKMLSHGGMASTFTPFMDAFKRFESDMRGLDGLPLTIRQISPADSQLRYASREVPTKTRQSKPANVVLQFEGSARWPDDLVAIQRTKVAFLLKISDLISEAIDGATARIGLENEGSDMLNQAYLDNVYDSGASFRVRIHHDREQTLLERTLKDKTIEPRVKDTAVLGLAMYKRDYIRAPAHTQAFVGLCSRHAALSGTTRLLKQWFASHLLANHVADEVIELIAARTFVQPWPWQAPSSIQAGFYRTLSWLARWDWRNEPLIADLSPEGDLKPTDVQCIRTNFEAWRKLDPALNRVVLFAASSVDSDGTTWTDGRPTKVIAGRMSALAKAARSEIEEKQLLLDPASLFSSPLRDFDFVIHLNKMRKSIAKQEMAFKNLEIELLSDDASTVGFDPLFDFVSELERFYGSAILFFSGGQDSIAGLWNPQTSPRPWTLHLSYSTRPIKQADSDKVQAEVSHEAILAEIAGLGGDLVRRIEVNSH